MRKLALALLLALAPSLSWAQPSAIGPANPILCNAAAAFTGSGSTAAVVAAVTGKIIVICGWSLTSSAAAGTAVISYGTGATCGTLNVNITGTLNVGISAVTDHSPTAVVSTPISNALCVNATNSTLTGII